MSHPLGELDTIRAHVAAALGAVEVFVTLTDREDDEVGILRLGLTEAAGAAKHLHLLVATRGTAAPQAPEVEGQELPVPLPVAAEPHDEVVLRTRLAALRQA